MSNDRPGGTLKVSELRERLRALGYLDGGLDRFVLAPARDERGTVGLTWRISVRIGALAGLLLGPAAAVGIVSRLPGLVSGPRDAVVVTAYLALLFGAGTATAAAVATLVVRAVARRAAPRAARRLAVVAGVIVAALCLLYLTLWWRTTAGTAWTSPFATALALALAVAISLALGHAVTISALALLARDDRGFSPSAPSASWRLLLASGVLAFGGAAALLAIPHVRAAQPPDHAPPYAVIATGVRTVLIGIDGFDPALLPQMDPATVPTLRRLAARAITVAGPVDRDPARVWTTVATGVPPDRHGVSGLELRRVAGVHGSVGGGGRSPLSRAVGAATDLVKLTRPTPVTGLIRRHKTIWEVAAEKGLNAAVVNWWASWPATGTSAVVISDRAALRLERGGPQTAEIAPDALYEPLRNRWPEVVARAARRAASLADGLDEDVARVLERSARLDTEQALLARDPLLGSPDLLVVYLPGLDIAQHALLQEDDRRSPSALLARLDALRRYYALLDELTADLLENEAPHVMTVLVTHPGRMIGPAVPTVAISGAQASRGQSIDGSVGLTDVAATILYVLGLPVSRDLAGRPLLELLDPAFVARHPVREIDSYGRYAANPPGAEGVPLDDEMMERLRSLGYIR